MAILAQIFGILIMALGLTIFASPQVTQKIFDFFMEGKKIYYAGIIRVAAGLILFLAASQSTVPLAAIALGLMFLMSGIIIFAADQEKLKAFMTHYRDMPGLVIRLLGLVAASFGILTFSIF